MSFFMDKLRGKILQKEQDAKKAIEEDSAYKIETRNRWKPVKDRLEILANELNAEKILIEVFSRSSVTEDSYGKPILFTGNYLIDTMNEDFITKDYIHLELDLNDDDEYELVLTIVDGDDHVPIRHRQSEKTHISLEGETKFEEKIVDAVTNYMAFRRKIDFKP